MIKLRTTVPSRYQGPHRIAYWEGVRAFSQGIPPHCCPYDNADTAEVWYQGYTAEMFYDTDELLPVVAKRTIGVGDTIFALAAAASYSYEITFVPAPHHFEWVQWARTHVKVVQSEDEVKGEYRFVDLDSIDTETDVNRVVVMAKAIYPTLEPRHVRLPWDIPKAAIDLIRADYPNIEKTVVLAPWCGGMAKTRSLPDNVIREVIAKSPYPILLRHSEPVPRFSDVPNYACDTRGVCWLFALISQCNAVISVDAGGAYVGLTLGKPTVVAFTHIDPASRVCPEDTAVIVEPSVPCGPCGDFPDPSNPPCPGDIAACANSITADMLLEALEVAVDGFECV